MTFVSKKQARDYSDRADNPLLFDLKKESINGRQVAFGFAILAASSAGVFGAIPAVEIALGTFCGMAISPSPTGRVFIPSKKTGEDFLEKSFQNIENILRKGGEMGYSGVILAGCVGLICFASEGTEQGKLIQSTMTGVGFGGIAKQGLDAITAIKITRQRDEISTVTNEKEIQ